MPTAPYVTLLAVLGSGWSACSIAETDSAVEQPLYPIFENGWGLIDPAGNVVVPPRFEEIGIYGGGSLFPEDYPYTAWALSDISGAEPTTDRVFRVRLDGKAGFATRDGRLLQLGRYDGITPRYDNQPPILVYIDEHVGFADESGELVIDARFDAAEDFQGDYAFVKIDERWGIIDRAGRMVIDPVWEALELAPGDPLAGARIGKQWGVIDRSGTVVTPFRFDDIGRPVGPLFFAIDRGQPLYIHPDGSMAFELNCPKRGRRTPKAQGFPFFGQLAQFQCSYRESWPSEGLVDTQGKFVLQPEWAVIGAFSDGRAVVRQGPNVFELKDGVVDEEGRIIVKPDDALSIRDYQDSVALFAWSECVATGTCDQCALGACRISYGLLDTSGQIVFSFPEDIKSIGHFSEGLAVAGIVGEDGRWKYGYIDKSGRWIVEPRFRRASGFNGPLATVEQEVGDDAIDVSYVDTTGKLIYTMRLRGFINNP